MKKVCTLLRSKPSMERQVVLYERPTSSGCSDSPMNSGLLRDLELMEVIESCVSMLLKERNTPQIRILKSGFREKVISKVTTGGGVIYLHLT